MDCSKNKKIKALSYDDEGYEFKSRSRRLTRESLAALPLYNPASDIADGLVSVSSQYNFSSWCFAID